MKLAGRYVTVTIVNIMTDRFIELDLAASRTDVALKS